MSDSIVTNLLDRTVWMLTAEESNFAWPYIIFALICALFFSRRVVDESRDSRFRSILIDFTITSLVVFGLWDFSLFGLYSISPPSFSLFRDSGKLNLVFAPLGFSVFVLGDFVFYYQHKLLHSVPKLWAFHQVHHSQNNLNAFTLARLHPFEIVFLSLGNLVGRGTVYFVMLSQYPSDVVVSVGVWDMFFTVFFRLTILLKHSSIWLCFPKLVSRVIQSPAMHQLHHRKHGHSVNFGGVLSLWDTLNGSALIPEIKEDGRFACGLEEGSLLSANSTLFELIWLPIRNLFRR